jgi:hypothetical protein
VREGVFFVMNSSSQSLSFVVVADSAKGRVAGRLEQQEKKDCGNRAAASE